MHVSILKCFIIRDTKKKWNFLLIEFVKRLSEIDIRRKTQRTNSVFPIKSVKNILFGCNVPLAPVWHVSIVR